MNDELGSFQTLIDIIERLRALDGCPWDREQTHASLKRNLLEECYEALEAIDNDDPDQLSEELGDILVQVAFHSQIAGEAQRFSVEDVLTKVNQKLIRRHPHVFGDSVASVMLPSHPSPLPSLTPSDAREVERNWEKLKEQERGRKSPVEGIPKDLPALTYAQLMQDRAAREGFDWEDISGVLDKVVEEVNEVKNASTDEERAKEMGDVLLAIVNLTRWMGIQAEDALRQSNARFRKRYIRMESLASDRGLDFRDLPLMEKEKLWQEAKRIEG